MTRVIMSHDVLQYPPVERYNESKFILEFPDSIEVSYTLADRA